MQTQPHFDGMQKIAYYVSSTYGATLVSHNTGLGGKPSPNLYLFYLHEKRPVDSSDVCLFICSEMIDGRQQPVLGIYDDAGHQILENEEGDLTDLVVFKRRAMELANERLGPNFVEFQHSEFRYKCVSSASEDGLKELIEQGWSVINFSIGSDNNKWFFLKKPKQ